MELRTTIITLFLFLATNAEAITLGFDCITENDPSGSSCAIAESQMSLAIESKGDEQVLFTFSNTGTIDSFIADVYFMYEGLDFLIFNSILNPDSGVSFSEGARPSHLPGYDSATASFSAGADPGSRRGYKKGSYKKGSYKKGSYKKSSSYLPGNFEGHAIGDRYGHREGGHRGGRNQNGINPGESLGILFDLEDASYDDLFAALLSGDLAIGIHAQGLGEFSESLIATPPAVVPLPATAWLFGSGLLVLFGLLKRSS